MIHPVDEHLKEWGRWALAYHFNQLGYPSKTNEYRMYFERVHEAGTKSNARNHVPTNLRAERVEMALAQILFDWRELIVCKYLLGWSNGDGAKYMGMAVPTYRHVLDQAHAWLAAKLDIRWYDADPVRIADALPEPPIDCLHRSLHDIAYDTLSNAQRWKPHVHLVGTVRADELAALVRHYLDISAERYRGMQTG